MKLTKTIVAANSNLAGQKVNTIAALPSRTAVSYILLFATSVLLYGAMWQSAPLMTEDSPAYLRAAQDLSDFQIDQLQIRTPGYPVLLLLTGSGRPLFFTSLLLHFVSIWLLASVLCRAGLTEWTLNLFAVLLLLPPYVEYAGYVLAEILTEFMLVAGFVSLVTWFLRRDTAWLIASAGAFAYSGLTRPVYQTLAFALAGGLLFTPVLFRWLPFKWRDMFMPSLVLTLTTVLVIGGYSYMNYRAHGVFGNNSYQLAFTLSNKTHRLIERLPDEYSTVRAILVRNRNANLLKGYSEYAELNYMHDAIDDLKAATGLDMPQLSTYLVKLNLLLIVNAPLGYLQDVLWAFCRYWFPTSSTLANMNSRSLQYFWGIVHFAIVSVFAINSLLLFATATYMMMCQTLIKTRDKTIITKLRSNNLQGFLYILAGIIVLYSAFIPCLTGAGEARYRVPTDSLIVFMCFLGIHLWRRLITFGKIIV